MISYDGTFESKKDVTIVNLPAGAYVGTVCAARVETQQIAGRATERLVIELDVSEGEYKDHYHKAYEAASGGQYPAKYKGTYRMTIPQHGDQYEAMNKRILQGAAWAFEQSNRGYHWDWDESKLKGLSVGFSVREADYLIDDAEGVRTGTTTEICKLESVEEVRAGKIKVPKKRELKDAQKRRLAEYNAEHNDAMEVVDTEDLPF